MGEYILYICCLNDCTGYWGNTRSRYCIGYPNDCRGLITTAVNPFEIPFSAKLNFGRTKKSCEYIFFKIPVKMVIRHILSVFTKGGVGAPGVGVGVTYQGARHVARSMLLLY